MTDDAILLTTNQLIDQIEEEFGLTYDRNTITAWTRREDDPLPVAYKGRPGQGHKYDWLAFLDWFDRETSRQEEAASGSLDAIDYHEARTIDMRERAKRSIIETHAVAGTYGEIKAMERAAEDLARKAVQQLLNIAPRLAPRLAELEDEVAIDDLLQREIRLVCNAIATYSPDDATDTDAA